MHSSQDQNQASYQLLVEALVFRSATQDLGESLHLIFAHCTAPEQHVGHVALEVMAGAVRKEIGLRGGNCGKL